MKNIMISVVVPVYNTEKFIGRCLGSLVSQDFEAMEIIVVDDGSTDESKQVIENFIENHDCGCPIHLISQENLGALRARMRGANESVGEYIMFVDSDDWLEPHAMNKVWSIIEDTDADIVKYNIRLESSGKVLDKYKHMNGLLAHSDYKKIYKDLFTTSRYNNNNDSVIRHNLLDGLEYDGVGYMSHGEDLFVNLDIFVRSRSVYFLKEAMYNYNDLRNNSSTSLKSIDDICQAAMDWCLLQEKKQYYMKYLKIDRTTRIDSEKLFLNAYAALVLAILRLPDKRQKENLLRLQHAMAEKGFYNLVGNYAAGRSLWRDKNLLLQTIKKNILRHNVPENYRYKDIIQYYDQFRRLLK